MSAAFTIFPTARMIKFFPSLNSSDLPISRPSQEDAPTSCVASARGYLIAAGLPHSMAFSSICSSSGPSFGAITRNAGKLRIYVISNIP